jgi:hypothetical protein
MEIAVLFVLLVWAFLMVQWARPSRFGVPGPEDAAQGSAELEEWGLLSLAFVRYRMAMLADELDRMDHDSQMFARAFHTMVARSVYDDLAADATRLAALPIAHHGQVVIDYDVDVKATTGRRREVLEL